MKALVTGITGQDGFYMAERLIAEGFTVVALVRDPAAAAADQALLGENCHLQPFDFQASGAIARIIEDVQPTMIFNYAAKSTGSGMFDAPVEMDRLNQGFPMDILHALLDSPRGREIRFVQASSSEMYGSNDQMPQDEASAFRPISPYGAAKLYVHNMIGIHRATNGLHASSAILFNHDSPRRGDAFVTKKIAQAAARIKAGLQEKLFLGNISSRRDWGYAPEYVDAMYRMAASETPDDYVVATGKMHGITDLLEIAFSTLGLAYQDYLETDPRLSRHIDSKGHCGNPAKIRAALEWQANRTLVEIVSEMVTIEYQKLSEGPGATTDRSG